MIGQCVFAVLTSRMSGLCGWILQAQLFFVWLVSAVFFHVLLELLYTIPWVIICRNFSCLTYKVCIYKHFLRFCYQCLLFNQRTLTHTFTHLRICFISIFGDLQGGAEPCSCRTQPRVAFRSQRLPGALVNALLQVRSLYSSSFCEQQPSCLFYSRENMNTTTTFMVSKVGKVRSCLFAKMSTVFFSLYMNFLYSLKLSTTVQCSLDNEK